MDQFSAHLDRGWELIQGGDSNGAELSARRALELDVESPEAYNLLGYIAALKGEFEDAIEHYQQAIALDDCYLEAMLNAAELFVHPIGDFEAAERLCDEALELAESDDERVDSLLLKFDALLGQELTAQAVALCERFPRGPFENPAHAFLVGRAFYEVGDLKRAAPLIEDAWGANPTSAETAYYLALVRDEQGRTAEATEMFLRSRELDLASPPPAWSVSPETLRAAVLAAVQSLPEDLRAKLNPQQIYMADVPGVEVVVDGIDPRAVLLVDAFSPEEGRPDDLALESEGAAEGVVRVFVYRRNLERLASSAELMEREVADALERELKAHFEPSSDGGDDVLIRTDTESSRSRAH